MKKLAGRILATILALSMITSILPMSVIAQAAGDGNPVDAAIFFSDLHTSKSDYKESTVNDIMSALKKTGLSFTTVTSCGDAFSVNEDSGKYTGKTSTITGYIQKVLGNVPVNYVWSDHDRYAVQADDKTLLDNDSGFIYGAGGDGIYGTSDDGNYYIYELSMADLSTNNRYNADFHSNAEVTATIAQFVKDAKALDQSKPLFIASHQPLLDRRNDNGHALEWCTAINQVAETMDVAFFFGHNHKHDVASDYYYAKGSTMPVADSSYNSQNVTLNFTHMCTGYMEPTSTGSYSYSGTRRGVAVAATIYEDSISYVTYDKDGIYDGSYALDVTVKRDHKANVEEPGETDPVVPPESEAPVVVEKTDEATGVVVRAFYLTAIDVNNLEETEMATVQAALSGKLESYVAYDITAQAEKDGEAIAVDNATVTLPIPEGVTNPAVYYVSDDGKTVEKMSVTVNDNTVSFVTTHFSYYVVGNGTQIEVPDEGTASGNVTTTTKKTVYKQTSNITAGNQYLIVNGNTAGSNNALANNNGTVAATGVTVKTDSTIGTYIELADATDELWTVAGGNSGYTFACEDGYLYRASSNGGTVPRIDDSATNWAYNTNNQRLSYTRFGTTYYLYYNNSNSNSGWRVTSSSSSAGKIYFYVPTEIEEKTSVSGTYSIAGAPDEVTKVVTAGSTVDLSATLTFAPTNGSASTTDVSTKATYAVVEGGDPNGVISGINGNTVTFSGNTGKALVKVSYTTVLGKVHSYITVEAAAPHYTLDITKGGTVVTGKTIAQKSVTSSTTMQLGTKIQFEDEDGVKDLATLPSDAVIEWNIPNEYRNIATVDQDTGLVSFKGVDGAFYVTATLKVNGKDYTARVNISATTSSYSVPSDGVTDFPEYPNEGAIRFDKTATAVGNFSETGIAQVELSMTGVPYTTGSRLDVVLMLDHSNSMTETRMEATRAAVEAFVKSIVKNEDGSFNDNRIYIGSFTGGNPQYAGQSRHEFRINKITTNEEDGFQIISNENELNALVTNLEEVYVKYSSTSAPYGTEYDQSLEECYNILNESKTDGNQQFCVFMSDGIPNVYRYGEAENDKSTSSTSMAAMFATSGSTKYAIRDQKEYKYEYWSTLMKENGVTVYAVGLGLNGTNSSLSGASAEECFRVSKMLLNDISGPAGETVQPDAPGTSTVYKMYTGTDYKNIKSKYFFSVDDSNADKMSEVFKAIAMEIRQAATDITVEDKITDEYTMIFDIPEGSNDITGVTNDFYIEFLKYQLDENHERTTSTSVTKLYLKNTDGTLSAASDNGTDYAAPVFQNKVIGDKGSLYYWSTNASDGDSGISVTVGGTTYYFVSYGMEDAGYNMTSGAYANGTVNATTNMSEDLVIATPYFVYNAATKMLYWTVDKLDTEEYALKYFLYLDNSATEVGTNKEAAPGSYQTNEYAYITYTNFNGNDCRQEFPVPQLTWNGAQVSYVFYLVNAAGQPINKSGQVVDFANASFITDIYTESVVWNKEGDTATGTGELSANWLAGDLLPDEYEIYDENAHYALNVHENADGSTIKNQFTIQGGTAENISSSLNERLNLNTTAAAVSTNTTKVYNTKAGEKISAYGTYYSTDSNMKDIDFANTTVAFAVVWQPRLVPDTVVVDYGLDVLINVTQNDILQNAISGIGSGNNAYGGIAMNTGVSSDPKLGTADVKVDGNTIKIENDNTIRFKQGDMIFDSPAVFYYETPVEFWEGSHPTEGYMYSSVTVIPATTIYYEDSFVQYSGTWTDAGPAQTATQAQDRPGASQISEALDADNIYGYDSAYKNCTTYSLNGYHKVNVKSGDTPTATFTFTGTGFDVISLTSNKTGAIFVDVEKKNDGQWTVFDNFVVDTYYGYTRNESGKWVVVDPNADNALYQVPVIKMMNKDYGQYRVTIRPVYDAFFAHNGTSYNFYLDAIRIYDPANDGAGNSVIQNAYKADHEAWPSYIELRDQLIDAKSFDNVANEKLDEDILGMVFIDGKGNVGDDQISDYANYGPNNEVYLASGQKVAFRLNTPGNIDKVHIGIKSADKNPVTCTIKNVSSSGAITNAATYTVATSTDMYYDLTGWKDDIIVIENTGSGILSLTNIKSTYTSAPNGTVTARTMSLRSVAAFNPNETYIYMTPEAAGVVVASLNGTVEQKPSVFDPETFDISVDKQSVKMGQKVKVTVTTSSDVEKVVINGADAKKGRTDKKTDTTTWTIQVKAEAVGNLVIAAIAYDGEGLASKPIGVVVDVTAKNGNSGSGAISGGSVGGSAADEENWEEIWQLIMKRFALFFKDLGGMM